ncbi:MAG: DUF1232 domain-containing protein [Planctomycetaceae bacterium]|nr:DUF1232 domain-containing protein [Planctomycetaceae bacterium]
MKIFFRKILKDLKNYIALAKLLKDDKRVPRTSKILLAFAIGYFLLPIDLIPDFIPVIGHLDDLIIVPTLIFIAIKLIPREVFDENYRRVFGN